MFQPIQIGEIFDPSQAQASDSCPAYWLAQLRKADWQELLKFVEAKAPVAVKKHAIAEIALQHFEFALCNGRGEVWQVWTTMRHTRQRGLVIQFRHSEADWSRGMPEFVDLEKNEPLGKVNIAGRLICKVK